MNEKNKKILLKVLCGMLPYGLKMHDSDNFTVELSKFGPIPGETPISLFGRIIDDGWLPCLRPMDDMTEEETEEFESTLQYTQCTRESYDWLDEHLFDYRTVEDEDGNQVTMIQAGLALPANKDMYNIKGI